MLCGPDGCACCQLEFLKTADENGKKRKNKKVSVPRNYHLHAHNKNQLYIYICLKQHTADM
jgi:hypothetical protein